MEGVVTLLIVGAFLLVLTLTGTWGPGERSIAVTFAELQPRLPGIQAHARLGVGVAVDSVRATGVAAVPVTVSKGDEAHAGARPEVLRVHRVSHDLVHRCLGTHTEGR